MCISSLGKISDTKLVATEVALMKQICFKRVNVKRQLSLDCIRGRALLNEQICDMAAGVPNSLCLTLNGVFLPGISGMMFQVRYFCIHHSS